MLLVTPLLVLLNMRTSFAILAFLLYLTTSVFSQSITIGGGASYSSHSFLKITNLITPVYHPISQGTFESFGQSLYFSVSPSSLEHLFTIHTGFGDRLFERSDYIGIKYFKFDYTFMYNLIAAKYKKPGGSFGFGVSTTHTSIRRFWLQVPDIELGASYDKRFWDFGFNANFLGSYGFKKFSVFSKIGVNYYLRTTLLDLHARIGVAFSIKR